MGPNVCSYRTVRILMLAAALLFMGAVGVRSQESEGKWKGPHDMRKNRVWSLWISFNFCGLQIDTARLAKISDEDVTTWGLVNPELIIIQWNHELSFEPGQNQEGYGLYDLLADYGQKLYLIQIIGHGIESGKTFSKVFWLSPAGLSDSPLSRAPLRERRSEAWTDSETEELLAWYKTHVWGHGKFFRNFKALLKRPDKKLDIEVKIATKDCEWPE